MRARAGLCALLLAALAPTLGAAGLSLATGASAAEDGQDLRKATTCFTPWSKPGGEKIVLLVGSLEGLPRTYIDASYSILYSLLRSGHIGCVGLSSASTWEDAWRDPSVKHVIFLGHGLAGDLSTASTAMVSPSSLGKNERLKLLMLIACQSLRKQADWAAAAPNSIVFGSDEDLPVVTAPLMSALTLRLMKRSKTLPPGGEVLKIDDPRAFLSTVKKQLPPGEFPGREFLDRVFKLLLAEKK